MVVSVPFSLGSLAGGPFVAGLAVGLLVASALAALMVRRLRRQLEAGRVAGDEAQALVEQAPDVILLHARDGSGVRPNAAARSALGLGERGELTFSDAVALEDQAAARAHLDALASGTARTDLRLRGPGAARPFDVVSRMVGGRVVTVARDVTERVRREQQSARERDQARVAVRDKSAFLDAMSHDLRTPLTAVLGFAELLRDEIDDESRGLVEAIETGGQRLLRTLDGVLDLARLDAGRQVLRPAPVDVVAVVDDALAPHRAAAEAAGLAFDVEAFSDQIPATLDPGVVERVIGTLASNAVAYTQRGGVTVEIVDDAKTVTLRVIDTGPGIPEDALPNLFSEHRRQPGMADEPVGVRALGLAVARRLVDLAGGTISVESRWGQGTAFTVVLPRGPIPELAPAAVAA